MDNPNFEIIYSCPSGANQLDTAEGWSTPINGRGAELFHTCCTFPLICGIPLNLNTTSYQQTHSGNSYVGIDAAVSYTPDNFREYIQSKLIKNYQQKMSIV